MQSFTSAVVSQPSLCVRIVNKYRHKICVYFFDTAHLLTVGGFRMNGVLQLLPAYDFKKQTGSDLPPLIMFVFWSRNESICSELQITSDHLHGLEIFVKN
jgi:hypothetical protein